MNTLIPGLLRRRITTLVKGSLVLAWCARCNIVEPLEGSVWSSVETGPSNRAEPNERGFHSLLFLETCWVALD